ncbi:helix-turn-helix domain-containing protein [Blautia wexlerae]|jgi:putative transcriptional regulator|nr:helix-turn-helix transcriptional regulator [Blautia wexlerae]NSD49020.1 helix-turn-helix transcriptional regulator [Blautia wexlerae]NSD52140.1 helix-turn-helix transcriptional regulator [Blautia wexlerae]NSK06555.1 helix-turn-helix transcriptional regulator [Blautia wexlerae]
MLKLDVKKYVDEQFDNLNQFAKATGLNYQAAQKIYNGETTRITFDNLESICKTLNVTPNDIFIFDDSNKESKQNPTQIQTFHSVKVKPESIHTNESSNVALYRLIQEIVDSSLNDKLRNIDIKIQNKSDDE